MHLQFRRGFDGVTPATGLPFGGPAGSVYVFLSAVTCFLNSCEGLIVAAKARHYIFFLENVLEKCPGE